MTKLNFRINPDHNYLYEQVTFQVTPIQEQQSSPAHARGRIRTLSSGASLASSSNDSSPRPAPTVSEVEMRNTAINNSSRNGYWSKSPPRRAGATAPTREQTEAYADEIFDASSSESLDNQEEYSTNERLLLIAFVTFMSFSITQLYFAFRAESEAMKGDSAAMMVDSATYLFNWIAERRKHMFDRYYKDPRGVTPERARQLRHRTKRKVILQLEIAPPLLSVTTLLIVTGVVLRDALKIIWLDLRRNPDEQSDPNINLMMMFALVNLGLDGVNFCCFARASHLFGYDTTEEARKPHHYENGGHASLDLDDYDEDEEEFMRRQRHAHANLNMCSAYTHVFADTLRSVAVIIAAGLAEIFDDVTAEEADAAAAVVVSLLILLSLVPLFQGLTKSAGALWAIRAEERSEAMMDEIKAEERKRRDKFWSEGRTNEWSS